MFASKVNVRRSMSSLTKKTINPRIVEAEYAVRGPLVLKSIELQKRLSAGEKLPFDKIISCNIGNPQSLGQKPIQFHREVLALVNMPGLVDHPSAPSIFKPDAISRAKRYLKRIPGGTGAYGHSKGSDVVREEVAQFLLERDGYEADPDTIFLTDGASQAVQSILLACIRDENDSILVPIPQYPLYSAAIAINGGTLSGYYLDESTGWSMSIPELKRTIADARAKGKSPRALVVINPGNPTGQILSEDNMRDIITFCKDEKLVLMADEVYQENVYVTDKTFVSFKKVLRDMESNVELASFHSTSKGFTGECGRRGGYMELVNFDDDVMEELYKLVSINLCSNIEGQLMVALMTNPPKAGEPSYDLYVAQRDEIVSSLKRRAVKLVASFNELEGVTCNVTEGAMYTFPRITVPAKAVAEANKAGQAPDAFYAFALLNATGIVVVPGSGFGQQDGTFHFRSTILPPEEAIDEVIEKTAKFHADFMNKYR
ncbi:hypothetical protein H257_04062 [Aphanomyces astaci]|uniref:Aminotransferase class I/classII large domain-containing protein n=1 Tax=Aphanomyces astaci TaxID=112090 RepID=W4GUE3_APHAT|nr:hypothetical protein H257_04062 [Aphanomyces astaci]ETV83307.1 hypothetical protein H257_04062 [Aphanomyces astaci]RQM28390.1 hypothetical protein B5M09_007974 [Aphanomyces astaci]|eukprot:XP_009826737.1 hypothetical protein H257_04062 [Aphanomyces astaci]